MHVDHKRGGGERYATTSVVQALRHKCIYLRNLWLPWHNEPVYGELDTRINKLYRQARLESRSK